MPVNPSGKASLSVNFSESSEAIRNIVQQVQQLAVAVRGVSQEFASVFSTMGQGGMGMMTQTGSDMGYGIQGVIQGGKAGNALAQQNAILDMNAAMAHTTPEPGFHNKITGSALKDLVYSSIGSQEGAAKVSFSAANNAAAYTTAGMTYQSSVGGRVINPVEQAAISSGAPYFGSSHERLQAQIMAAQTGKPNQALDMSDVYRSMNANVGSIVSKSQSDIERLSGGSAFEKELAGNINSLVERIKELQGEIKENSRSIQNETAEQKASREESNRLRASQVSGGLEELQTKLGNIRGEGGSGGGGGLGGNIRGIAGSAFGAAAAGMKAMSMYNGFQAGVAGESIGAMSGALLTRASVQGSMQSRMLRSMDMADATNQLEFGGDLLTGDPRLGESGRRAAMQMATFDNIGNVEKSRLESHGAMWSVGAKLVGTGLGAWGTYAATTALGGAAVAGGVISAPVVVPVAAAAAAAAGIYGLMSSGGDALDINKGEYGRLSGGNPGSMFGRLFGTSKIDNDEAANAISGQERALLAQRQEQSLNFVRNVAENNPVAIGALTRIQRLSDQYRAGFATAGRYNPGSFGAYAARNIDLSTRSAELGISPEELQGTQIGIAANAGAGTGASISDAQRLYMMSRSGAGSIEQLMGNVAGLSGAQTGANDFKALMPLFENAFSAGFDKSRLAQQFVGTTISLAASLGGGSAAIGGMLSVSAPAMGGGEFGLRRAASGIEALSAGTDPLRNPNFWGANRAKSLQELHLVGTPAGNMLMDMDNVKVSVAKQEIDAFIKRGDFSEKAVSGLTGPARALALLNPSRSGIMGLQGQLNRVEDVNQQEMRTSLGVGSLGAYSEIQKLKARANEIGQTSVLSQDERTRQIDFINQRITAIAGAAGVGTEVGAAGHAANAAINYTGKDRFLSGRSVFEEMNAISPEAKKRVTDQLRMFGATIESATSPISGGSKSYEALSEYFARDPNFKLSVSPSDRSGGGLVTAEDFKKYTAGGTEGAIADLIRSATPLDLLRSTTTEETVKQAAGSTVAGSISKFLDVSSVDAFTEKFFDRWKSLGGGDLHRVTSKAANDTTGE